MKNDLNELIKELKDQEKSLKNLKKNPDDGFWTKEYYSGALTQNKMVVSKLKQIIRKN